MAPAAGTAGATRTEPDANVTRQSNMNRFAYAFAGVATAAALAGGVAGLALGHSDQSTPSVPSVQSQWQPAITTPIAEPTGPAAQPTITRRIVVREVAPVAEPSTTPKQERPVAVPDEPNDGPALAPVTPADAPAQAEPEPVDDSDNLGAARGGQVTTGTGPDPMVGAVTPDGQEPPRG